MHGKTAAKSTRDSRSEAKPVPAVSLYIHVPFCRRRCPYCAFASNRYDPAAAAAYLDALEAEFDRRAAGRPFLTLYLGGGTPTALDAPLFDRLLALIGRIVWRHAPSDWAALADFDQTTPSTRNGREASCEANPGTVDAGRLRALRDAGVTRLSLGAQTFDPAGLAVLGRIHDALAIRRAFADARAAGFERINLDLLHGWPGQTRDSWRADLEAVRALAPEHVSCYALTVEDDAPWADDVARGRRPPPDEEALRAGWDMAGEVLEGGGWTRYEVSNFARPDCQTRHHLQYWTGGEYVGLGAAAHSHEAGRRFANAAGLGEYGRAVRAGRPAEVFSETLAPEAKARETLVTWLRLAAGVPDKGFRRRTGFSWRALADGVLARLCATGGVEIEGDRLRLARAALPVADTVLRELV